MRGRLPVLRCCFKPIFQRPESSGMTHPADAATEVHVPGPGAVLTHPMTIAMLALWIISHYLKAALGNELTGKLSDVAVLLSSP